MSEKEIESQLETWPNFFIVGVAKTGTTSLYNYLKDTPGVFLPQVKEPNYFHSKFEVSGPKFLHVISDKKKYLELFKEAKDAIAIGESSTFYFEDYETPNLIHKDVPHAKIIIVLRDPVDRAFSHYLWYSRGREKISFHDALYTDIGEKCCKYSRFLEFGFYADQVKRYLDTFGQKQVKIILSEELMKNTKETVKDVLKFLGINNEEPESTKRIHNTFAVSRGKFAQSLISNMMLRKIVAKFVPHERLGILEKIFLTTNATKPKMSDEDRKYLQNLYRDDVKKLETILNRQLPWPTAK